MLYQPFLQTSTGRGQMVLHVRVSGDTGRLIPQIREAVQASTKTCRCSRSTASPSEWTRCSSASACRDALGVLWRRGADAGLVGLYGLMSFTVARRTAEIGVRVALGAARLSVLWMVIRQTLVLAAAGVALGVPLAWIAARLSAVQLSGLLFDLAPTDAATLALASSAVMLVALVAGWLPARRAARIEPARALRAE